MAMVVWLPRTVLGGVALLGVGMALVTGGVRVGALFLPGVIVLGLGFLLLCIAGLLASVERTQAHDKDASASA